jgi:NADH-quinone oxidoreductase subunit N
MATFNLSTIDFAWLPLLPLIAVSIGAMVVLLVGVWVDDEDSAGLGFIALVTLLAAFILALFELGQNTPAFHAALVADDYAVFFETIIIITAAVTVAMSLAYAADAGLAGAEYYALVLFATLGMMLMVAADDLIVIFLGLETMSISVYALAGFVRRDPQSSEAAIKYFLLGAFSTGFLLYGIALIYGATGTIRLDAIRASLASGIGANPLLLLGLGMLLIGFGFKVAAVPFHMWTPDAYEGAPTPITAFMAVGVKLAAFGGFLRIFMANFGPLSTDWASVLWVLAAITMTAGNVIALVQTSMKRMLAYSAIAHAGYVIVGMAAGSGHGAGAAILYYLLTYAFTNLGAFAVVIAVEHAGEQYSQIRDYRGLAQEHPALAAALALCLLSLAGVPPLAGFVGKFYVFVAALNAGLVWLVVIAVLNAVLSAYYYIGVIVAMYMQEGGATVQRLSRRPGLLISIAVGIAGVIVLGVYPQPYMGAAVNAFATAVARQPLLHAVARLP